jgi:FtsZ-binding cell division protein ZapB
MNRKFEIGDDGSIFSIGEDGTIHRIGKIDSRGNIEEKNNNSASCFLWFFLVAAIVTAIIFGVNLSNTNADLSHLQSDHNSERSELKQQNEKLQSENSSLQYKFDGLRERFPIKITRIELANTAKNRAVIDDFGSTLYSSRIQYLSPKIYFENYLKEAKTINFEIHYVDAWGKMEYNTSSGKIPTSEDYISTTETSARLTGWGTESGGSWKSGSWTVEIWCNGVCFGSKKFTIY